MSTPCDAYELTLRLTNPFKNTGHFPTEQACSKTNLIMKPFQVARANSVLC
jgi:hypothetical protein